LISPPTVNSNVDLHLHSTASDGMLTPRALIAFAAQRGVRVLALTDHDTTSGLDEAHASARGHGLELVAGAELSANWRGRGIHILGLAIDPEAAPLIAGLERTRSLRRDRARAMTDRLKRHGLPGDELFDLAAGSSEVVTRTHLARALVARGIVADPGEAFARWLSQGRPGHVQAKFCALEEVVGWIRAAGGHAVVAHPLRYTLSAGTRRTLLADFKAAGGAGIEVITGGQSPTQVEAATGLALRAGLAASVGSDFHDPAIPWNPPGRLATLPTCLQPIWMRPGFPRGAASIP
jgi:3',5'-nucleoside bisphosphate phosphatase